MTTRHNLIVAPLAGISDYPFREICRQFDADLTFSEMVSIDGLYYGNEMSKRLLSIHKHERPIGYQLFGSEPEMFKKVLPETEELKPDVIDLNFGCPVRKVVRKGAGAALLKNLNKLQQIVETVVSHTSIPVTAKIRIGWDRDSIVAIEAARAVEAGGALAVTVHARRRDQGYIVKADWQHIADVKSAVKIPVIGNGDVIDGPTAESMFRSTGADGIMLARAALGRPWIFREILQHLMHGIRIDEPSLSERIDIIETHYALVIKEFGKEVALPKMKKHIGWYVNGLPFAGHLRNRIFRAKNYQEIQLIFNEYKLQLAG